jgi:hypothetical protein
MKKHTSQTDKQKGIEDRQTEFDYSQTRNEDTDSSHLVYVEVIGDRQKAAFSKSLTNKNS